MFKGYDVRGIYGDSADGVNEQKFFILGKALSRFQNEIAIGMDYRSHNETLAAALAAGFEGKTVFLGRVTTPCAAFCSRKLGASITASHNPPEYAGLKPFRERRCFYSEELAQLKAHYAQEESGAAENEKEMKKRKENAKEKEREKETAKLLKESKEGKDEVKKYVDSLPEIEGGIFDLGGGAACAFKRLFSHAKTIFAEPDPLFSKREPEPKDETLGALKEETLKRGALGFAFDGDADRVVAVDKGKTIDSGALAAFYAQRFLRKGDVVALTIDVSDEVCGWFAENGFKLEYSAVGDINVTRKADEAHAAFSMERSGHYAVTKHLLYSDGVYFAAALSGTKPGEITKFAAQFTHETLSQKIDGRVNFRDLEKLFRAKNPAALETVDGIKARFDDYCVLVRPSQTEPIVRVSVEAADAKKAQKGLEASLALTRKASTGA